MWLFGIGVVLLLAALASLVLVQEREGRLDGSGVSAVGGWLGVCQCGWGARERSIGPDDGALGGSPRQRHAGAGCVLVCLRSSDRLRRCRCWLFGTQYLRKSAAVHGDCPSGRKGTGEFFGLDASESATIQRAGK